LKFYKQSNKKITNYIMTFIEFPRIGKTVVTENRLVVARAGGRDEE
jgi:hypothetical protein